jgi:hypothetical protein
VYIHPYVAAELSRQRRADLVAAAGNARRARALRQRGRHPLTVRLAAAVSASRGRWGGLRLRQSEAGTGRSTRRELRNTSPRDLGGASPQGPGPVPPSQHPQAETTAVPAGR